MDISKEALNFVTYISKTIARGFRASKLSDNSIHVEFSDHDNSFDFMLVADYAYHVFVVDFCPAGMVARPNIHNHRERLGYFMLEMSKYNIKMNKRLSNLK